MKFVLEGIWSDFVVTILGDHMSQSHIRKYNAINFGIIPSTGSLPRHVPNNHKKTKRGGIRNHLEAEFVCV